MARARKMARRPVVVPLRALEPSMQEHVRALGLETVADYLDWCRVHGFRCSWNKTTHQRGRERREAGQRRAEHALCLSRGTRRPGRALLALLDGDTEVAGAARDVALAYEWWHSACRLPAVRAFADRLLRHVLEHCKDLPFERVGSRADHGTYLQVLLRMAELHEHALRPVEDWRPRTRNARRRATSLARHLFARYELPEFLNAVWFDGTGDGTAHRRWFVRLGAGASVRSLELPLPCTRRMAHHFLQAPDDYGVVEALRWGQVHALGGDAALVRALRGTRLCTSFQENAFWESVLAWLIRHPVVNRDVVGPIIDYLHEQRFVPRRVRTADGRWRERQPEQPNLCMARRDPARLLQELHDWHVRLGRDSGMPDMAWAPSGVTPFRWVHRMSDGARRVWTCHELCSTEELAAEGRAMKHCVVTYVRLCVAGHASIWSMGADSSEGAERRLTVQVRRDGTITQARGFRNARATPVQRRVLMRWAREAGLVVAEWV